MKLNILYKHRDFYLIDKPHGWNVHDQDGVQGFFNFACQQLEEALFLCHRLDKETSGILILARNNLANRHISTMFQAREINKYYLAVSDKKPKKKQGLIKGDLEKARGGSYKLMKSMNNPVSTRFYSCSVMPGLRIYFLKPVTGKTHQLRVSLKAISAPILGVIRYRGSAADRMYLHAMALNFEYNGEMISCFSTPKAGKWFQDPRVQSLISAHPVDQLPWK